jgi:hypothetical protein
MHTDREITDEELQERLRQLRVDPPSGDFEARLHRRLVEEGPRQSESFWARHWPWFAALPGAVTVALAAVLLVGRAYPDLIPAIDGVVTARVPATQVAMLRVRLTVDVPVQSADIRVTLPEGLVFWSDGERLAQRSFEWSQPLTAGANEIPIAVRGDRPGRYHVKVTARVGGAWIEHDVALRVIDG